MKGFDTDPISLTQGGVTLAESPKKKLESICEIAAKFTPHKGASQVVEGVCRKVTGTHKEVRVSEARCVTTTETGWSGKKTVTNVCTSKSETTSK
jgi:hypothetical protein